MSTQGVQLQGGRAKRRDSRWPAKTTPTPANPECRSRMSDTRLSFWPSFSTVTWRPCSEQGLGQSAARIRPGGRPGGPDSATKSTGSQSEIGEKSMAMGGIQPCH